MPTRRISRRRSCTLKPGSRREAAKTMEQKVYGLWNGSSWMLRIDGTVIYDTHMQVIAGTKVSNGHGDSWQVREIGQDGLPVSPQEEPAPSWQSLWQKQTELIRQIDDILETPFERDLLEIIRKLKADAERGKLLSHLPVGYFITRQGEYEWEVEHHENGRNEVSQGKTAEEAMNNACVETVWKREHREAAK